MKQYALLLAFAVGSVSCKSPSNFMFKDLEKVQVDDIIIPEETPVNILSFSGGPDCTDKVLYYYQYIGVIRESGDTIRILSPCQLIPENTSPEIGYFMSFEKMMEVFRSNTGTKDLSGFFSGPKKVVYNKNLADLENGNFPTVVGTLSFK